VYCTRSSRAIFSHGVVNLIDATAMCIFQLVRAPFRRLGQPTKRADVDFVRVSEAPAKQTVPE